MVPKMFIQYCTVLICTLLSTVEYFYLETDASAAGLGAVLSQKYNDRLHPIAYASHSLSPAEKSYGILRHWQLFGLVSIFMPICMGTR